MSIPRTLRAGLLATLPLFWMESPARAQQPTASTEPAQSQWFLGPQLGAQVRNYSVDRRGHGLLTRSVGLQGAYAPTRRLVFQAGIQYGQGAKVNEELEGSGQFAHYPQTERITQAWVVPASVRWSLAANPHRFEVTALLGASLCFFHLRETGNISPTTAKYVETSQAVNGYLDLGLGGQLRASRRVNVTLDLGPNVSFSRPVNSYWPVALGFNSLLGINYRLN